MAAYCWLLTDAYPWFQEESGSEPRPWGIEMAMEARPGMSLAARVEGGRCLYSCDFAPASARP